MNVTGSEKPYEIVAKTCECKERNRNNTGVIKQNYCQSQIRIGSV